jgi:succinate dehydrogenase / fumarate reductase membrane anchor subunit
MASTESDLRSPLGRARGLGSAKLGVHHWWIERLTAIALVPLTVWFVLSLLHLRGAAYPDFLAWVASPLNATALILFIAVGVHHGALGAQVVIEDYVVGHGARTIWVIATRFFCYGLGALAILSTLIVTLGR